MERASRALEEQPETVSLTWIEKNVQGKGPALREGVKILVAEGYFTQNKTPSGFQLMSAQPYREADDLTLLEEDEETASPPRPHRVPDLVSVTPDPTASPRPLSKRDGDAGRSATPSPNGVPTPSPSWEFTNGATPLSDEEVDAIAAALDEATA